MIVTRSIAVLFTFLLLGATSYADVAPLLNIDPAVDGSFVEPANNKTWGWSFHVDSPIRVTHLAWNDTGRDGLSHSHQVGLWKDAYFSSASGGTLLTSVTIPAGTIAELSGPWRRVAITPIDLQVGYYAIGGQNNLQSLDDMVYKQFPNPSHVPGLDPRVAPDSFTYNINGQDGFYAPGTHGSEWYAYWGAELGANLFVENVPEPSPLIALSFTLAVLYGRRKYRFALRTAHGA